MGVAPKIKGIPRRIQRYGSFYNGWWFIGNESASRAQVKVDYFYVDTQETIRFDGNSFMTFNSLNTAVSAPPYEAFPQEAPDTL